MLVIGCSTAIPVRAENLEAGKSPSQIFAGGCSACHKGIRGLVRSVAPGSLPGFLRQHYTTSSDMAGLLSAYLLSNGAIDARGGGGLTKQGKDAISESKPAVSPEQSEPRLSRRQRRAAPQQEDEKPDADAPTAQGEPKSEPAAHLGRHSKRLVRHEPEAPEAAKPDADASTAQGEPKSEPAAHPGRHGKRLVRHEPEAPETAKPGVEGEDRPAAAAASDTGPGDRPLPAKHKLSKRGKQRREPPKTAHAKGDTTNAAGSKTEPAKDEPSKGEAAKTEPAQDVPPKDEGSKTGGAKPADEGKAEAAKAEGSKSEAAPAVAPAPRPSSEGETWPSQTAPPVSGTTAAVSGSGRPSEPPAAPISTARPAPSAAETSPPVPSIPAGTPAPSISQ
jgi:hypothetical protein